MKIKKKSNTVRVPPLKKAIKVKRNSLDIEEESTVSKALENLKKVFKRNNVKPTSGISIMKDAPCPKIITNQKKGTVVKKHSRGIVYLGHIPHGFYEEEMTDYFKQFGRVTRVRIVRSKNTGRSRGYGYVQFMHEEVAKVTAETMNNYLMCGRLLKATYIPPEKRHARFFVGRSWTKEFYPKQRNRSKTNRMRNNIVSKEKYKSFVQSTKDKFSSLERKLSEKGLQMEFIPLVNSK